MTIKLAVAIVTGGTSNKYFFMILTLAAYINVAKTINPANQ